MSISYVRSKVNPPDLPHLEINGSFQMVKLHSFAITRPTTVQKKRF